MNHGPEKVHLDATGVPSTVLMSIAKTVVLGRSWVHAKKWSRDIFSASKVHGGRNRLGTFPWQCCLNLCTEAQMGPTGAEGDQNNDGSFSTFLLPLASTAACGFARASFTTMPAET